MCALILSLIFVLNISHFKNNSEMYKKKCVGLHVKYPLFLSGFNQLEFS